MMRVFKKIREANDETHSEAGLEPNFGTKEAEVGGPRVQDGLHSIVRPLS